MILRCSRQFLLRHNANVVTPFLWQGDASLPMSVARQHELVASINTSSRCQASKRKKAADAEGEADGLFGDDLFGTASDDAVESPATPSQGTGASPDRDRSQLFHELHSRLSSFVGKNATGPPPPRSSLQRLIALASTKRELDSTLRIFAAWHALKLPYPSRLTRHFVGRACSLDLPDVAVEALASPRDYGLKIDSEEDPRVLLRSLRELSDRFVEAGKEGITETEGAEAEAVGKGKGPPLRKPFGLARIELLRKSLTVFRLMPEWGIKHPDPISLVYLLAMCAKRTPPKDLGDRVGLLEAGVRQSAGVEGIVQSLQGSWSSARRDLDLAIAYLITTSGPTEVEFWERVKDQAA